MAPPALPQPYADAAAPAALAPAGFADGGMPVADVADYLTLSVSSLSGGLPAQDVVVRRGAAIPLFVVVAITQSPFYHIFLHLTVAQLARCRAVHKTWRYVIDSGFFRQAHYDHQSRQPMPLCFFRPAEEDPDELSINLRAIDLRGRALEPLIRFAAPNPDQRQFRTEGSWDGILLLSYGLRMYVVNPSTRDWLLLPDAVNQQHIIIGFYRSRNGAFTVLYHDADQEGRRYWNTTLDDPIEDWYLGLPHDPGTPALEAVLARGIAASHELPPVSMVTPDRRHILYWLPQAIPHNGDIICFDTVTELFDCIPPPLAEEEGNDHPLDWNQLIDIRGTLGITRVSPIDVDIWIMYDALGGHWAHFYHIDLQGPDIVFHNGYDTEGALRGSVLLYWWGSHHDEVVECPSHLLHTENGVVVRAYLVEGNQTVLTSYSLQENLLRYDFLPMRYGDADDDDPPFLRGH